MIDIKALCGDVCAQAQATPPTISFPPVYDLVTVCANRWPKSDDLCVVLRAAGLSPGDYDLNGPASQFWADAFFTAWNRADLPALLEAVERGYSKGGFTPRTGPSDPGPARFNG